MNLLHTDSVFDCPYHDLSRTFDNVGSDLERKLLEGSAEIVFDFLEVDSVELAAYGTLAASDTHVDVNLNRAAAEAACCFCFDLCFCKGFAGILEALRFLC